MKNVCVVLRNIGNGIFSVDCRSVTDAFLAGGYRFFEIRLLPYDDAEALKDALSELKEKFDNLALVADGTLLPLVSDIASRALCGEFLRGTQGGAGIFRLTDKTNQSENTDKTGRSESKNSTEKTAFLLASDAGESGAEYVKNVCIPFLNEKYSLRFDRMAIRAVGADDRLTRSLLGEAVRLGGDRLSFDYRRKYDEEIIGITYDSSVPKMLTDDVLRLLTEGLGEAVYALDDTPLERRLVEVLKLRGKKISVAESFTGGGIAKRIVSVAGASEVYFEGLNTYAEESKMLRLGVTEYTLRTFGAVSDETAYEMAAGLISAGNCDISIATTGLAGPKSDRTELPVGLCYIAVGLKENVYVYRFRFDGSREEITETAITHALFLAYRHLKNS